MTYTFSKDTSDYLLSVLKDDDVVTVSGKDMIDLINSGKTFSGRKPISVDRSLFDRVVDRWQKGEITAREAMKQLNLKPNTFYRRVKERTDDSMKNIIEGISDAGKAIDAGKKELRKDIHNIGKQLYSDAKEVRKIVDEKVQVMDIKSEMYIDKIDAKISHREEVDALKDEVKREAQEHKSSNK